jgi:hypothetical protein
MLIYCAKKHASYKDEHEDLLVATNDVILEVNAERTKPR